MTTGGVFDADGYQVRVTVAGQAPRAMGLELNTSVVIGDMPPGEASVELDDLAPNCSVSGGSSRTIAIQESAEFHLDFQAACTPPPELGAVRLVFSRWVVDSTAEWGHRSHLWAMNADGTDLRQLTYGATYDSGPIVSPDGARIAFSRPEWTVWGDALFTYVMEADGSNLRRLNFHGQPCAWSPDGSTIAIGAEGCSYLVRADGSGHREFVGWQPAWSPDGNRIAFRRSVKGLVGGCDDPTAAHEIWTINVDLTDPVLVKRFSPCSWGGARHPCPGGTFSIARTGTFSAAIDTRDRTTHFVPTTTASFSVAAAGRLSDRSCATHVPRKRANPPPLSVTPGMGGTDLQSRRE